MPKRGILGCSFPVLIVIVIVIMAVVLIGLLAGPVGRGLLSKFDISLDFPSWFSVPQPAPELPAATVFHILGFPITNSIIGAWITMIVVVGFSFAVTRRMKVVPGRIQSAFEFLLGWLYDFCRTVAGEENGRKFFPVVATIFLFVAFNAWLSLLPGFGSIEIVNSEGHHVHLLRGANTDINLPLALALVSFVFVEYFGLRSLGLGYLKKFFNVGGFFRSVRQIFRGRLKDGLSGLFTGFIDMFVGLLEALSEIIRIVSFTFRLFGNMTAGEILLIIVVFLVPWFIVFPFQLLELLVGFVQALIFGGLTLVFLTMAVARHGE